MKRLGDLVLGAITLVNRLVWLWVVTVTILFPVVAGYSIWRSISSHDYWASLELVLALVGWSICMLLWGPTVKASLTEKSTGPSDEVRSLGRGE